MSDEAEDQEVDEDEEHALVDIDMDAVPEMTGKPFPEELYEHLSDPVEEGEVPEAEEDEPEDG